MNHEKTQPYMPVLTGVFVMVGCALIPFYRYALLPDGISYVSIASEYAAGFWSEAVNAYWSPLYSWCIAPLLLLHIPALISVKVLDLAIGVLTLLALRRISRVFEMEERARLPFLWTAAAMVLGFVLDVDTPDLLFTTILLLYFGIIFDSSYSRNWLGGAACGLLGGLAYLSKGYGLIFFAAHFLLLNAVQFALSRERIERRTVLRSFVAGFAVFGFISFLWIAALHSKYGVWTTGTSGAFNLRLVGPESAGYPQFRHLIPPSSEHAVSAWEDPSPAWLPNWSIFGTKQNEIHELRLLYSNSKLALRMWAFTTPLFIVIVPLYALLCAPRPVIEWVYPFLTIALFGGGYLLVSIENRYLWLTELLLLWIGFRTAGLLSRELQSSRVVSTIALYIVAFSFVLQPILTLRARFEQDKGLYLISQKFKHSGLIKGRIASCANWPSSDYVAFRLGDPYYGVPTPVPEADEVTRELNPDYRPSISAAPDQSEILRRLQQAGINYFIVWPDCPSAADTLGRTVIEADNVRVVKLTPNSGH